MAQVTPRFKLSDIQGKIPATGFYIDLIETKGANVFAYSNDFELIKSVRAVVDKPGRPSQAQEGWTRQAASQIDEAALAYVLLDQKAIGELAKTQKQLPNFTEWSATMFFWDNGFKTQTYAKFSASYPKDRMLGPADQELVQMLPQEGMALIATNSLRPGSPGQTLLQAMLVNQLLGFVGEQALLSINKVVLGAPKPVIDAHMVVELKSAPAALAALNAAVSRSKMAVVAPIDLGGVKCDSYSSPMAMGYQLYLCRQGRWLVAATTDARAMSTVKALRSPELKPLKLSPGMPAKNNAYGFIDFPAILAALGPVAAAMAPSSSGLAGLSFLGRIEFAGVAEQGGMRVHLNAPIQPLTAPEWSARLAPLLGNLEKQAQQEAAGKAKALVKKANDRLEQAIIAFKSKRGKFPLNLKLLVPKFIKRIPEEPLSRSNRVAARQDAKGGWFYDRRSGIVQPNSTQAAAVLSAP